MSNVVLPSAAKSAESAEFSASDAVSDSELGGNIVFGMVVGTPLTFLAVVVICMAAGLGWFDALSVAVLPCLLSGIFFGGVIPLSLQMARHERAELETRPVVTPAAPIVDGLAIVPTV